METARRSFCRLRPLAFALFALALFGCEKKPEPEITLQVGPEEVIRFGGSSGFAHYYELPGQDDILRIVLASYPLNCDEYEPPKPGEVFITVTVRVPPPKTIEPGKYPWTGLEVKTAEDESDSAQEDQPAEASALPFVRLAEDARTLPPGGELTLSKIEPETFGLVEGELGFRDAETGQAASTALMGPFSVRLCHLGLDATRRGPDMVE